jgi:hypothetical protein
MSSEKKPSEALALAADLIERVGLYKSGYWDRGGGGPRGYAEEYVDGYSVCSIGALSVVLFGDPDWGDHPFESGSPALAEQYLARTLGWSEEVEARYPSSAFGVITHFNDDPGTTAEDVVAKMRAAAEAAAREGK